MTEAAEILRVIARSVDVGDSGRVRNIPRFELIAMARNACDALGVDYSVGVISTKNIEAQRLIERAPTPKDDWHKPRTQGNHLTADEIELIRAAFKAGRKPSVIARELKCASRTVSKYYQQFRRGDVPVVKRFRPAIQNRRFHTSDFEI
jgi:hypothetical protein